jgi:hypothetical protein
MIIPLGNVDKVIYFTCLLAFNDNEVVFDDEEIEEFKEAIYKLGFESGFPSFKENDRLFFPVFDGENNFLKIYENKIKERKNKYDEHLIDEIIKNLGVIDNETFNGLFYYHHRIVIQFNLNNCKYGMKDRDERWFFSEFARSLIEILIEELNHITENMENNEKKRINTYLGYFIKFQKNNDNLEKIPEKLIETETIRILENYQIGKSYKHYLRISIPGMTVYFDKYKKLNEDESLITNILNAVFSHLLYPMLLEARHSNDNPIMPSAKNLEDIWEKVKEDFGGSPIDNQLQSLSRIQIWSLIISIVALFVSIISFLFKK